MNLNIQTLAKSYCMASDIYMYTTYLQCKGKKKRHL